MRRAACVVLAAGAAVLATGCGVETGSATGSDGSRRASSVAPAPSTAAPSEAFTPSPRALETPVYFVGPTPMGPALFSELRSVDPGDAVGGALTALADGPRDPDYTTYLRPGALRMESYDEAAVLVVPDAGWTTRPDELTDRQARLALQQVVLTVQAALDRPIPVGFTTGDHTGIDGALFGSTAPPDANGYVAAKPVDVLALVNVTAPDDGEAVADTFTVSGVASSFEGTVPWQVLDGDGAVVLRGAGVGNGDLDLVSPWRGDVDVSGLAPGRYTLVAMTDDPTGGTDGPGPTSDSKTIVVS